MDSAFGLNYALEPRPGSSVTLGETTNAAMTIEIKRGYFGCNIKDCKDLNNTKVYFKITFSDGCSTGFMIQPDYNNKLWFNEVEEVLLSIARDLDFYCRKISERARLFNQIEPLQKKASEAANSMFNMIERYTEGD